MKQQYNIRLRTFGTHPVDATLVKGHKYEPEIQLIAHKSTYYNNRWVITETKSGLEIVHGKLRKEAIENLAALDVDKETVLRYIDDAVRRYGAAN